MVSKSHFVPQKSTKIFRHEKAHKSQKENRDPTKGSLLLLLIISFATYVPF